MPNTIQIRGARVHNLKNEDFSFNSWGGLPDLRRHRPAGWCIGPQRQIPQEARRRP